MNNENETNKSTVTSYRLKEDTKENIKRQLTELGLTQEEYFNKVVSVMELENVKKNNIFAVDATELQQLTQRICNIFIGLCDQGNSFLSNKSEELEQLKNKYKDMLLDKDNSITKQNEELQQVYNNISILQSENDNNKNELMNIKTEYNKQLQQLENNLKDKTLIVEEYKQKNDMLLSDLQEGKQYKEQYKALQKEMEQLKVDNESLKDINNKLINDNNLVNNKLNNNAEMIEFYKSNNTELKADIKVLEQQHKQEIEQYKEEQKEQLQGQEKTLQSKYEVELSKKDLEIQKLNNTLDQLQHNPRKKNNKTEQQALEL